MLSPVPAVSSVSSVTSLKPATVGVETLIALIAAMPDTDVALARAANLSVEGKLNMLLIAARERMIDSLFAVVDAVSEGLNLPQEQGETNSAYALRLADAVENLSKPQLAALQQQLTARGQTLPLPLIAAALKDPTGQAAAQVIAYLEVVRYKDRDLATKAVVSSYGQNAAAEEQATAPEQTPQSQARPATTAANPIAAPANSNSAAQVLPIAVQPQAEAEAAAALLAAVAEAAQVEQAEQIISSPVPDETEVADTIVADSEDETTNAQASQKATAGAADQKPQTVTTTSTTAAVREAVSALPADIEERLKAVVKLAIDAAGPELLDIMANSERLSETVVAQALIADMLDDQDLAKTRMPADMPDDAQGRPLAAQNQPMTGASLEAGADDAPSIVRLFIPAATASAALPTPAAMPAIAQPPLPLGVPFAMGQYLPVDEPKKEEKQIAIDRVDPIDGEGKGGNNQRQASDQEASDEQASDEREAGTVAAADAVEGAATETAETRAVETVEPRPAIAGNESLALPKPQAAVTPAFDLYQRMANWQ